MFEFKRNLKFTGMISVVCALASIFIQYIYHETPCLLCLYTRIGFIMVTIACFIVYKYKKPCWLPIVALFFLLCLSFYHLGVENHWWIAPESCRMVLPTLEQLNMGQFPADRPPCDKVGFQIFGISVTLFSFIIASFLTWLHSIALTLRIYKYGHLDD